MISGINHITLAVSNLVESIDFYCGLLGCHEKHIWPEGAYLEAGDAWLCLTVCDVVDKRDDYTHVAFSVSRAGLALLASKFKERKVSTWQDNSSEGDSIYFLDPDGHKLEIHVGSLDSRMHFIKRSMSS